MSHFATGLLALLLAAPSGAGSRTQSYLYVLNKTDGTVSVIDPETRKAEATIPVGAGPHEAIASPDGRTVVVANYGARTPGHTLSVIDTRERKIRRTIDLVNYHRPHGILYLPDGKRVVVTAEQEKKLLIVDIDAGKVESAIDTRQLISHMVALTPDARRAFVANIMSGSVSVIDLEKKELLQVIQTGEGAEGIAAHPTRNEVWVSNRQADTVSIIDTRSLEKVKDLPCPAFPIRVAFTTDGAHALVSCPKSGDVTVFSVANRAEVRRIAMQEESVDEKEGRVFGGAFGKSPVPIGILVEPGGGRAYIANTNADVVSIIDLATWKVTGRLTAGRQPDGLAWAIVRETREAL